MQGYTFVILSHFMTKYALSSIFELPFFRFSRQNYFVPFSNIFTVLRFRAFDEYFIFFLSLLLISFFIDMEQTQEAQSTTTIPQNWKDIEPSQFLELLRAASLKDVMDFARSSPEAGEFITQHINDLTDLNPYSILIEDYFPTDADNIYEFSVLVRLGHNNAQGVDEERLLAKTAKDLREIVSFLRPDVLDIKLTYFSSFKDEIESIMKRPLSVRISSACST